MLAIFIISWQENIVTLWYSISKMTYLGNMSYLKFGAFD